MDEWQPQIVASAWASIDHAQKYDWPKKPFSVRTLQKMVPSIPADIGRASDKASANRLLRRELNLRALSAEHRSIAARWIVRDWGGIGPAGDAVVIPRWLAELKEFMPEDVSGFIDKMGTTRISSWSKLLAFADHKVYAIYDSWTALALNYGLAKQGEERRFFMPPGKMYVPVHARSTLNSGQVRDLARKALLPTSGQDEMGYASYLNFLAIAVRLGLESSLLDAEMFLFANGYAAAQSTLATHSA